MRVVVQRIDSESGFPEGDILNLRCPLDYDTRMASLVQESIFPNSCRRDLRHDHFVNRVIPGSPKGQRKLDFTCFCALSPVTEDDLDFLNQQ
jgi:hypothetical protein